MATRATQQSPNTEAIQTEKGHIITKIMGCDESFPMREWHKLLPQIKLTTMNMLRGESPQCRAKHISTKLLHTWNT
jgi:hypothetical protein